MQRLFLYRLYHHSRIAFLLVVVFVVFYAILFFKKMDMVLFPYNNMFSLSSDNKKTVITYRIKINQKPVNYTKRLYWKKDFLETSLSKYVIYHGNGNKVLLHEYLYQKNLPDNLKFILEERLTPHAAGSWPVWYANFAGWKTSPNESVEIYQYSIDFNGLSPVVTDSLTVYKIQIPR